ncbi:hypothetical protein [Gluconacetobacter tumulicola]|uniref:Uncharacterized protein n=1 Tax=Gluconacetobacter tumulicola TaxID=1017177 RepID=A0A7W4JEB2_9PROT|nr:hypothetical protein [Gluconacetobacter tumulicola]MBB2179710.1 hypothetical protein [Gluconacetobacter tumulicola]
MAIQKDDDISNEMSASDMAVALVRACGWSRARKKAHTHVMRCIETDRTDEAAFWMAVRNILDHPMNVDPEENDMIH